MEPQQPATFRLQDQMDLIRSMFDDHHEGILMTDAAGTIIYYNDAQSRIDEMPPEEALHRRICEVYKVKEEHSPTMQVLRTQQKVTDDVHFYRTSQGHLINSVCHIYPLFAHGVLCGALSFIQAYSILQREALDAAMKSAATPPRMALSLRKKALPGKVEAKIRQGYTFATMIGTNPLLTELVDSAQQAALTPSPILLIGETGVGKEVFARSIHNASPRREQNFTAINCSAVPESLLEGILFGTAKGAFTGAEEKPGLFESASGGTLFLDEVDSMPVSLQSKLLRALQERRVRRVGDLQEREIDVKLISSIGRHPDEGIRQGVLRKDFFYRIGVVQLHIPPLRERMEDILPLALHFVTKHSEILGLPPPLLTPEVMAAFYEYAWPGNVRELEHAIEASLNIIGSESSITIEHLRKTCPGLLAHGPGPSAPLGGSAAHAKGRIIPLTVRGNSPHREGQGHGRGHAEQKEHGEHENGHADALPFATLPAGVRIRAVPAGQDQPRTMPEKKERMEMEDIAKALTASGGRITTASRLLGISAQLLHYKLKKYGIQAKDFIPTRL